MASAAVNGDGGRSAASGRTSELLRLATAGSVDDGKSTLIGRLLFDSKQVLADQLEHVEETSRRRGDRYVDLALLTDGLRAEREQGITIDVAYRYMATPRRRFIIADTPGHAQYTRNMVTGASTADLSLVLVDARHGIVEQSRRHAHIAALLGIPHLVVCVNKMDLVDFDESRFDEIVEGFEDVAAQLGIVEMTCIPISALLGDNVVDRSANMPWYQGPTLLHHLEHVHIAADRNLADVRFPVQWVIRPMSDEHHDYRAYAGQVAGGILAPGDEVVVLPAGQRTRIEAIDAGDGHGDLERAFPPMSVSLRLADALDISRGDVICGLEDRPSVTRELDAMVCWMGEAPLRPGGRYMLKHTTRSTRARVEGIAHRVEIESFGHDTAAAELALNDIGRVRLRTGHPLVVDPYARNRSTGALILIDEATNDTVGAGMIVGAA